MTKQVLSANNARFLTIQLTKPMAEITKIIINNVKYVKGLQQMVKEMVEQNRELLDNLMVEKIDLVPIELGHLITPSNLLGDEWFSQLPCLRSQVRRAHHVRSGRATSASGRSEQEEPEGREPVLSRKESYHNC